MSNPTLNDLVELAGEQARTILIKLGKDLVPSWVLVDNKGTPHVIGTPWKNDLEKEMTKFALRKHIREHKIVAYSFVMEGWSANKPAGWTPESDPAYEGAVKDPERREVVIAFATDGKAQKFRAWAIQRDWNEQVRSLELLDAEQNQPALSGWIAELLS